MDHERRRLLMTAALTCAGWNACDIATAAESAVPALPDPSAAPAPTETVIALDAHAQAPGSVGPGLSYGGPRPGLVFRAKKDTPVKVRLINNLSEATALDWHGMRLPNAVGGLKGPPLPPGRSSEMTLRSADSGSYWFHAGLIPGLSDQTAQGLRGVLIVEDEAPPSVDEDKVLLLTDAAEAPGPGAFAAARAPLVNGRADAETDLQPPGARLRLRLVNGSTRQAQVVAFEGSRPLVAAIDGQPSELFAPLNNAVPVGPGARFDILVDLPRTSGAEFRVLLRRAASAPPQADQPIYRVKTDGAPAAARDAISALPPNPALPRAIPLEHSVRATLVVERHPGAPAKAAAATWSVNGAGSSALPAKPLFTAKRDTPVTLAFQNKSRELIAIRLHGHVMRLLHAMDDGWEPYWRDSVLVPPGITHHAAFLADNPGQWLLDSPFFEQATGGLRTWFEVL